MPSPARSRPHLVTAKGRRPPAAPASPQALLATVARCSSDGQVWLEGHAEPALVLATAGALARGMRVLVQRAGTSQVIVGRVLERQPALDSGRLELAADREVVIRCGQASLTLTEAGKAILAGEYVLTRARGVNKIKGGSVQIN